MDPQEIIDANHYMTLGTADASGLPWLSPVYFVADGYRDFYWISKPSALHSRNLAVRPELSIVIYDSTVPVYHGEAVYLAAEGALVPDEELDTSLAIYNSPAGVRGAPLFDRTELEAGARLRLYRASVREAWALDNTRDERIPVQLS
ncbi:pyridoxamine 5'-phosphate oxidase family protein [Actinoplanes sp. GCM10030250]|uniref:pyridoxamine 5'-phosphate oxidase family protein n=1 Tax=Actinoplanes sp. GCM10030250 TaxID=3273376 RepID=UPI00360F868D